MSKHDREYKNEVRGWSSWKCEGGGQKVRTSSGFSTEPRRRDESISPGAKETLKPYSTNHNIH